MLDSLNSLLAGGNTPSLYSIINTGTPGQIESALLAPGPYLSDSVLNAAINKNLPPGTIKNILIPNSPLDSAVMSTLNGVSLPKGIRKQIDDAQVGTSPRTDLEQEIASTQFDLDIMVNTLIRSYLADTTINGRDSALSLLSTIPGSSSIEQQVSLNISLGNYNAASTLLAQLLNSTGVVTDFYRLSNVLIQLGDSSKNIYQLNTTQLNTIEQLAYNRSLSQSSLNAQAILTQVYGVNFADSVLPVQLNSTSGHRSIKNDKNSGTEDNLGSEDFSIYPNPASSRLNIAYNLGQGAEDASMTLYDVLGNKIAEYILPSNQSIITENIANLPAGFYVYSIFYSNKIAQRGKIIISR